MPELARLGLLVAEAERQRKAWGEGGAAQVGHGGCCGPGSADQGYIGGAAADVDEDAGGGPRLLARARSRKRVWLRDGGGQLEVELTHDCVDGVDVGHRRERVEDGDLEVLAREAHGVGDRIAVDTDVGDRGMDEARFELAVAPLELKQVLCLAQRAPLDHLQHGRHRARPHPPFRFLARVGDGRRKALDQLAGDPDHDLAGNGFRHVLGRFEGAVAGLDHRLQVGDRSTRHRSGRLRLAADPEDLAVETVSPDHKHFDEVGADVEHGEVAVVVAALAQELELRHVRASSRRLKASAAVPFSLPRARCRWPPPLPRRVARRAASYSGVRSLDTLITNWSPATTLTTPHLTISTYRYPDAHTPPC